MADENQTNEANTEAPEVAAVADREGVAADVAVAATVAAAAVVTTVVAVAATMRVARSSLRSSYTSIASPRP